MHKRALDLSRRIRDLAPADREAPLDSVWQAQCNCAYWHGVFGGLYLPHLRDAVYRRLIAAETALDAARGLSLAAHELDLVDQEGRAWFLRNAHLGLGVAPEHGGMLFEWGDLRTGHNLGNTLTRRAEAYHERLRAPAAAPAPAEPGEPLSIHERARSKEPGLEKLLVLDPCPRASFLDHVLDPAQTQADFQRGHYLERADFARSPYAAELDWERGRISLQLARRAAVAGGAPGTETALEILKGFTLLEDDPDFEVRYRLTNVGPRPMQEIFVVEWNVTLLTGQAPDRWIRFDDSALRVRLDETHSRETLEQLVLADEWLDLRVEVGVEPAASLWMFPVETVSLSEDGFERNYQGTCLAWHWPLRLGPGESRAFRFECRHRAVGAAAPRARETHPA